MIAAFKLLIKHSFASKGESETTEGISPQPQISSCFQPLGTRQKKQFCCSRNESLPEDLLQHHWLGPVWRWSPPGTRSSRRSPRPRAAAAAEGATRGAGGWLPRGRCPSPTWLDPPRGLSSHTAERAQNHGKHFNQTSSSAYLIKMNVPRFLGCRKRFASRAEREVFFTLMTHKALFPLEGADHLPWGCSASLLAPAEGRNAWK